MRSGTTQSSEPARQTDAQTQAFDISDRQPLIEGRRTSRTTISPVSTFTFIGRSDRSEADSSSTLGCVTNDLASIGARLHRLTRSDPDQLNADLHRDAIVVVSRSPLRRSRPVIVLVAHAGDVPENSSGTAHIGTARNYMRGNGRLDFRRLGGGAR